MNEVIANVIGKHPELGDYDKLPIAISQYYTPNQWAFMSDEAKANVERANTEPDA